MTDLLESLEIQYAEKLAMRCQQWQTKHPDAAALIRAAVWEKIRRAGQSEPEPGSMGWHMFEEAVNEAIRAMKGWPTNRQFIALQGGQEPAPPTRPLKPIPPAVTAFDAKAKAAGE